MACVWSNVDEDLLIEQGGGMGMREFNQDEGTCVICFGEERSSDVYFSPCGHKACAACVQKVRIANVYKADKGVRCPFCRQVIDGYLDTPPSSATTPGQASVMFHKGFQQIKLPYGRGSVMSIGGGNDYVPPKGVTGMDGGGLRCTVRQEEPPPGYVLPSLKSTDDVVSMAFDKTGARHLSLMLREGYVKRDKVAKTCREMLTPYAAKLAVHPSGNFVLQRLLEYAASHRIEGSGDCFFTALVRAFTEDKGLVTAAQDQRGTFSVQKMLVSLRGAEELSLVTDCVQGSVVLLALDQYGVYVLERLVEVLITSLKPTPGKKARVPPASAFDILTQLCKDLVSDARALINVAKHQVSGVILVECIRWSLPQVESLQAAMAVANSSENLVGSRPAHKMLQGILSLDLKQVAERLVMILRGRYVELSMDQVSSGFKLVRSCLATSCLHEEMRLLIVDELLNSLDNPSVQNALIDIQNGCDVLAFGLCILTRRVLDERLETLANLVARDKFQRFKEGVEAMRKVFFVGLPSSLGTSSTSLSIEKDFHNGNDDSGSDVTSNPGFTKTQGQSSGIVDPWNEEYPPIATQQSKVSVSSFKENQDLQSLATTAQTNSELCMTPAERQSSHSPSNCSFGQRDSMTLVTASKPENTTYQPPHLRGAAIPALPPTTSHSIVYRSSVSQPLHSSSTGTFLSKESNSLHMDALQPVSLLDRCRERHGSYLTKSNQNEAIEPDRFSDEYLTLGVKRSVSNADGGCDYIPMNCRKACSLATAHETLLPEAEPISWTSLPRTEKATDPGNKEDGRPSSSGSQQQPWNCLICRRVPADTVLFDCSHLCCCLFCSKSISVCPVCRSTVREVVQVRPVVQQNMQSGVLISGVPGVHSQSDSWTCLPEDILTDKDKTCLTRTGGIFEMNRTPFKPSLSVPSSTQEDRFRPTAYLKSLASNTAGSSAQERRLLKSESATGVQPFASSVYPGTTVFPVSYPGSSIGFSQAITAGIQTTTSSTLATGFSIPTMVTPESVGVSISSTRLYPSCLSNSSTTSVAAGGVPLPVFSGGPSLNAEYGSQVPLDMSQINQNQGVGSLLVPTQVVIKATNNARNLHLPMSPGPVSSFMGPVNPSASTRIAKSLIPCEAGKAVKQPAPYRPPGLYRPSGSYTSQPKTDGANSPSSPLVVPPLVHMQQWRPT